MSYRCARCHSRLKPSRDPEASTICKCGGVIEECGDAIVPPAFWERHRAARQYALALRLAHAKLTMHELTMHEGIWLAARKKHLAQMRTHRV